MSNDKNISNLIKKKILTTGSKSSLATKQVTAPKSLEEQKDKPTKAKKVNAKKITTNAQKAIAQPQQAPQELQLSDFNIHTTSDVNNLYLTTTYLETPIHTLIYPVRDFSGWQRTTPQQRYAYVQARVNPATFNFDLRLVQIIVTSYVQRIYAVFARVQQQQAHANMAQQQTQQAPRRMYCR